MKYNDSQLLSKIQTLPSYKGVPNDFWILGVQSNADKFNEFDDKFYLFKGAKFIMVTTGTTNAGASGLQGFQRYSPLGCAVIKTDEWYYDLWAEGLHKGKMKALRQQNPIKYYRDNNGNIRAEMLGKLYEGIIGINFHTATYEHRPNFISRLIGGWSLGCQVVNNHDDYYHILELLKGQKSISYCLIKEF